MTDAPMCGVGTVREQVQGAQEQAGALTALRAGL